MGVLKYVKQFLPQNILKNFCISIVEPHFRYFSSVWGVVAKLTQIDFKRYRTEQNSACNAPPNKLLTDLGLRSISELKENELIVITFKSLNHFATYYSFIQFIHCNLFMQVIVGSYRS